MTAKYLDQFLKSMDGFIIEEPFKTRFSASGLPYCPVLDFQSYGCRGGIDYRTTFYVDIGTAYHTLAQRFLVAGKYGHLIFGNWELEGKEYKDCFRPKPVKRNGITIYPIYKEIDLKYGLMTGHSDMLALLPWGWTLLDWKTTSHFITDNSPAVKAYYPQEKHKIQLSAYAVMLRKKFYINKEGKKKRIKVKHIALVYVSRNKSDEKGKLCFKHFPFEVDIKDTKEKLKLANKGRKAVLKALEGGTLEDIIKYKPCKDHDSYYHNGMQEKFFGNERCPFHQSGVCYKYKKLLKELKIWKKEK